MATRVALALTLALMSGAVAARDDDDTTVPLDQLPREVVAAIKGKFPTAKLVSAEKGTDAGKPVFEVEIEVKGRTVEVTLTPAGKIVEIDREIDAKELPAAVTAALRKRFPRFEITDASEVSRDDKVVSYWVEVTTRDKRKHELTFDPSGKLLEEKEIKEEKKDK
jgi:uncharacterized membrane protein YkoI